MGKTVMVVEDHDDSRAMMRIMIESYGYDVIEARDGAEAIEMARAEQPHLILMDVNMPNIDGLTAAGIIKSSNGLSKVPIIAVTAFTDFRDEAIAAGCSEVLRKPVEFPHLKNLIDVHIS